MNKPAHRPRSTVPGRYFLCAAALAVVGVSTDAVAGGAIYKWKDGSGVTHFTNVAGDEKRSTDTTPVGGNATLAVANATTATDLRSHAEVFKFRDATGV